MRPRLISGWPNVDLSEASLISHDNASSVPPPSANPSTIAIVGLETFQTASHALSSKNGRTSSESFPANSEISAPAANACGLGLFPSVVSVGEAPLITTHRILSSEFALAHSFLIALCDSVFRAFSLSGLFSVQTEMIPPLGLESSTSTSSTVNTS